MEKIINFGDALEKMEQWLFHKEMPPRLQRELKELEDRLVADSGDKEAKEEIIDRFYKELEFGTGGLRGIIGAGTNRINVFTIRRVTQGFANYINRHYGQRGKRPSMAIAYDSRNGSARFALESAGVLAANGILVYIYDELMPTPALSFAVRHYGCAGGIMITASHNPSDYNGYKAYNHEGAQLTDVAANEVLECVEKVDIFSDVKVIDMDCGDLHGHAFLDGHCHEYINIIPEEVVTAYIDAVKGARAGVDCSNLEVVYTPLNGTGNKPVRRILSEIGVSKVHIVPEQEKPDGNFPTCPYPNPEKEEALLKGLKLSHDLKTPDLLLATDPDCDRLGVAVRHLDADGNVTYNRISGNEIGVLLLDFLCSCRKLEKGTIAMKTIVSTKMADEVAKHYGIEIISLLTGFKYIGEQIGILEANGDEELFLFGFEESYGYLAGSYVRDKDAVNAAMLVCEAAAYYKKLGKTLIDRIEELYYTYGWYLNELLDFNFEGAKGMLKMREILAVLRQDPPKEVMGLKIIRFTDYKEGIDLPPSNMLEYVLEDGSCIIIRPSGTEPKLKVYLSVNRKYPEESKDIINRLIKEVEEWILTNE